MRYRKPAPQRRVWNAIPSAIGIPQDAYALSGVSKRRCVAFNRAPSVAARHPRTAHARIMYRFMQRPKQGLRHI
jgi:hypothetical protein